MQWYYANDNQRLGPVSEEEFQRLVAFGSVRADTLVWRQGLPNWVRYAEIAGSIPPPLTGAAAVPLSGTPAAGAAYPSAVGTEAGGAIASPVAPVAYPAPNYSTLRAGPRLNYAGFWIRFAAKIIDGLILNVVCIGLIALIFASQFRSLENFDPNDPETIFQIMKFEGVVVLIYTALSFLYSWIFVSKFAATPGKLALGLRIVRADGSALSQGRVIGRFFAEMLSRLIFNIGYLVAAFDDEKRTVHDHVCDTRVIKK